MWGRAVDVPKRNPALPPAKCWGSGLLGGRCAVILLRGPTVANPRSHRPLVVRLDVLVGTFKRFASQRETEPLERLQ
jgi:hypothetical protein